MPTNKNDTLIMVKKKTAKRLQDLKITNRESYDEVINRILDKKLGDE
jgi:hypothetical protein